VKRLFDSFGGADQTLPLLELTLVTTSL